MRIDECGHGLPINGKTMLGTMDLASQQIGFNPVYGHDHCSEYLLGDLDA